MKTNYQLSLMFLILIGCVACKTEAPTPPFGTVDFSYSLAQGSANTLHFVAKTTGTYQLLEWTFPTGNPVQNTNETDFYFPKKGDYHVSLIIWNKGEQISASKTIRIEQDDPNYNGPALLWSDEFDGNSLNTSNWTLETNIRFNDELQTYQASGNHQVANGLLTIIAQKVDDNTQFGSYTSARLNSKGKKEYKYGRFEVRARLPKGRGAWPAIWMLGSNIDAVSWPTCGEMDIMEYVGYNPGWVKGSIHCGAHYAGNSLGGDYNVATENDFHVYGVNWTASKIEYYVDDRTKPYFTYSPAQQTPAEWPFNQPFFFILNVAIGGTWGGAKGVDNSIFPLTMEIDYVRVFANQ